jgi:DNA-binding transcriptional MerR regulator
MKDLSIKKLYYSISEVSRITDLEQYVLRYWETEFEELKPQKNRAGNRIYTNRDIRLILHIKKLLREERYTIEGAKQILKNYDPSSDGEQLNMLANSEDEPKELTDDETLLIMETPPNNGTKQISNVIKPETKQALIEIKKILLEIRESL